MNRKKSNAAMLQVVLGTVLLLLLPCLAGCESDDAAQAYRPTRAGQSSGAFTAEEVTAADRSALFLGNSHSSPIPHALTELFAKHRPSMEVIFSKASSNGFLDEQVNSETVRREITEFNWDFVILQAQKYSTSGKYSYSIDGAVELAELAREHGAKVILYPEFPREGVDEYARIRAIHESISQRVPVEIAPIGEAWSLAQDQVDESALYAGDGNHASGLGNYLIASVFLQMLAPEAADGSQDNTEAESSPKHQHLWDAAQQAFVGQ